MIKLLLMTKFVIGMIRSLELNYNNHPHVFYKKDLNLYFYLVKKLAKNCINLIIIYKKTF